MDVTTRSHLPRLTAAGPPVVDMNSSMARTSIVSAHADARSATDEKPDHWSNGLDWVSVFWIGMIHVGALAAPFFFTWKGLLVFLVLGWVSGGLGVCLGYHRLLTHRSFHTFRLIRWTFALFGVLAGEGPPITWVAVHRKHHHHADKDGDPHTPRDGAWWSHIVWLFPRPRHSEWQQMIQHYAKDLMKDPFMRLLDKTFLVWHFALWLALFTLGSLFWDSFTGVSFVVYGMFVRLVYVMHVTWLVNSASHMWGYRSYDTHDDSRNLWWVGLLAYGEGWHNNHHAFPARARHGHRPWELDATYFLIRTMEFFGLAWDVIRGPTTSSTRR